MSKELIGAMVTPFNNSDEIDYAEVLKLISRYEESKHDAIVVAGTTGEETSLTAKEKIDLIKKRLPEHSERRFLIAEIFHFLLYIKDNFSFLRCGLLFPSILI